MGRKVIAIWLSLIMIVGVVVIVDVGMDISLNVGGTTLYVNTTGSGGAYTSIQDAINDSKDGDTVFVYSGTYYGNISVNKTINLTGEGKDKTIIDGVWVPDVFVVYVSIDWVNITGFTITQGWRGIYLTSSNNKIINNNISSCGDGIFSTASSNNKIIDNNISNYENGIYINGHGNNITGNNITNNSLTGIGIGYSQGNTLYRNTMINNGIVIYGQLLEHWNTHKIDNTNTVNGKPVYYWKNQTGGTIPGSAGQVILANCTNVTVINQDLNNCSIGIELGFSSNILMTRNNISNNNYEHIYLSFSNENNITDNNLINDRIRLYKSHGNKIINNKIIGAINSQCIFLYSSNDSVIKCNMLTNADSGILIRNSEKNNITGNEIFNNGKGIEILSNGNNITGNNISNNSRGIVFRGSYKNNITYNNIYLNRNYGIYLTSAENNSISQNNIINNNKQAFDDTGKNFWNSSYPAGGNFWSEYLGVDEKKGPFQDVPGSDGIGDTPYKDIEGSGGAQDYYPLMSPVGDCIFLYEDWHLISIPFIQMNINLGNVLESMGGTYDFVQWYNANDNSDLWKHNSTLKPSHLNDLDIIDHRMGFWVHITEPGGVLFEYPGTQPSSNQTIQLYEGWNMVGYPSLTSYNRTIGLNNLTFGIEVDEIQWYDASTQTWHDLEENDYFVLGRGYWVHAKAECVWEVPL
ncbi:MAG: right-handed parallel beta-helix repeat-containing protein [Thermoplasmata archaeon]|nr:MAG: right-handed parallel beta-helix repeat-containing protein [Thermoplasmata archaeon]